MKRIIISNVSEISIDAILDNIVSDNVQRRIYGKFMNTVEEHSEAYLQGVLDLAEISNISLPGIIMLWELILAEGVAEVRKQCLNRR